MKLLQAYIINHLDTLYLKPCWKDTSHLLKNVFFICVRP